MNNQRTFLRARYEWLDALSSKSSVIKSLNVKGSVSDSVYETVIANAAAFAFSNSDEHNKAIAETIEQLAKKGASGATLKKFITDLTGENTNTYGTFAELSGYRLPISAKGEPRFRHSNANER